MAVVEAAVYLGPCVGCQLVMDGTDERITVAGGEGVEGCIVGGADGPSYCRLSGLGGSRLGDEGCPAGSYEVRPTSALGIGKLAVRWWSCRYLAPVGVDDGWPVEAPFHAE